MPRVLVHRHRGRRPSAGRGRIHLLILLHQGPPARDVSYSTPWPLAAVELDEQPGLRFVSTVVDCPPEQLRVGLPVELTWIERDGAPWYAFRRLTPDRHVAERRLTS